MKVELLYFDGCPTYLRAEETLRGVLAGEGVEADIELVAVNTDEEAQELRFPGSPTIRLEGEDLFRVPERAGYALGCTMYATPEGLRLTHGGHGASGAGRTQPRAESVVVSGRTEGPGEGGSA